MVIENNYKENTPAALKKHSGPGANSIQNDGIKSDHKTPETMIDHKVKNISRGTAALSKKAGAVEIFAGKKEAGNNLITIAHRKAYNTKTRQSSTAGNGGFEEEQAPADLPMTKNETFFQPSSLFILG